MCHSFLLQDPAITTSMPVLDLVDSLKPGSVNYDNVSSADDDDVIVV